MEASIDRQRPAIGSNGAGRVMGCHETNAQVIERIGALGIDLDRTLTGLDRFRQVALDLETYAEIAPGSGIPRSCLEIAPIARQGRLDVATRMGGEGRLP